LEQHDNKLYKVKMEHNNNGSNNKKKQRE